MNKITIFSTILLSVHLIFGQEDELSLKQKILFAYQFYSISKGAYSVNREAEATYSLEQCLKPPKRTQPFSLGYLFWWEPHRENYGILNAYALKYGLGPHTPFPSDLLRVEGIPLTENFIVFYSDYIQNIHLNSNWSYRTHTCDFLWEDEVVIDRILRDDSGDKKVLFLGFDASKPTEGGDIFFDTPRYRHSLFWSNFKKEATPNHNRIKSCFCQSQILLDLGLSNYFDYIIIGGQTVEYLNWETWGKLRHFLKIDGYIVYPEMIWHYWGGEIINHLLNSFGETSYEFELQRCNDPNDPVFSEIKKLSRFNNVPSYGSFCYGNNDNSYVLYLHKKIAREYK